MSKANYSLVPALAWLLRKSPVRRSCHAGWIRKAAGFLDEFPVYTFKTKIVPIRWTTAAMPDLLTRHLLFEGLYQEDVLEAIRALSPRGGVVFDVGAHHGFMTCVASGCVGAKGQVVSFEPNPLSVEQWNRAVALNQLENVALVEAAVGDHAGKVALNIQKGTATWNTSLFRDVIRAGYEVEVVEVDMVTIDAYVEKTGLAPDVIKIDVEGAEFLVIKGALKTIQAHRPALIMEFNPIAAEAAHTTIGRLVEDLTGLGYALRVLRRNRWGRYAYYRSEPFDEAKHCQDDLANILCVPE